MKGKIYNFVRYVIIAIGWLLIPYQALAQTPTQVFDCLLNQDGVFLYTNKGFCVAVTGDIDDLRSVELNGQKIDINDSLLAIRFNGTYSGTRMVRFFGDILYNGPAADVLEDRDSLVNNFIRENASSLQIFPAPANLIENPSWEFQMQSYSSASTGAIFPWERLGDCQFHAFYNPTIAQEGSAYFATNAQESPRCVAMYQDIHRPLQLNATYHLAVWVRSEDAANLTGKLALQLREHATLPDLSQVTDFQVSKNWQCIETQLTVNNLGYGYMRAAMYLGERDEVDFYMDNSQLQISNSPICPITASNTIQPPNLNQDWQSATVDNSTSIVWGDINRDGHLDVVVGKSGYPSRVYLNQNGNLQLADWQSEVDKTNAVALGDIDHDGDLDLVVGNIGFSKVYLNDQGRFQSIPIWTSSISKTTKSIALGDINGDGFLDVILGNYGDALDMYLNNGAGLQNNPAWSSSITDTTTSLALADMDKDGDLDLAVGTYNSSTGNKIYLNNQSMLESVPSFTTINKMPTKSIALGDVNQDRYLDLITANWSDPVRVFFYKNGSLQTTPDWSSEESTRGQSIAWGDINNDNYDDIVLGTYNENLIVHLSDHGELQKKDTSILSPNPTNAIALGDGDNDGDLDVIMANGYSSNKLYLNQSNRIKTAGQSFTQNKSFVKHMAWGDFNGDGYADVAVANKGSKGEVYMNNQGQLSSLPIWQTPNSLNAFSVAWGDVDNDGDLDLIFGVISATNQLYLNQAGNFQLSPWQPQELNDTLSLAWADVDGDGDVDLAIGNSKNYPDRIYLNNNGTLNSTASWENVDKTGNTITMVWGDVDNDGDLDLAIAGDNAPAKIYFNDHGQLAITASWMANSIDTTSSIALGDINQDGLLDLALGNQNIPNKLYLNKGGTFGAIPDWASSDNDSTTVIRIMDMNNDGTLDLVAGAASFSTGKNKIYFNKRGVLENHPTWLSDDNSPIFGLDIADINHDGDFEMVIGNNNLLDSSAGDLNKTYDNQHNSIAIPTIYIQQPNKTSNTNGYASAEILSTQNITLTYTLFHSASMMVDHIEAYYSLNGGGKWLPAVAAEGTITQNLATSPSGTTHTFVWNTQASGFFAHTDNVVIRLVAIPSVVPQANSVAGEYRYGSYAATTLPFRVRGVQIQVKDSYGNPMPNAIVYRNSKLLVNTTGMPLETDSQGYLQGQAEIKIGDQLMALAPIITATQNITWTNAMTLYYTNGIPTATGVEVFSVRNQSGVQELVVSADHSLLLFDLWVSLEFDASRDSRQYLDQLMFKLQQTSQYLFNFTHGQVAFGKITVMQNGDSINGADIVIHSSNVMRPFATIGGVVITATVDGDKTYFPGQIHMPATWNKWGDALGSNESEDWSLVLAHELGHYLFFLEDTYIGVAPNDLLIATKDCPGAMGDVYTFDNQQFMNLACGESLASRLGQPAEWTQILHWYPWLKQPANQNVSSNPLPAELTTVTVMPPVTSTDTLADVSFYLDYITGTASSNVQAYLIRGSEVYNLGSPIGGQNLLWARGARPNDKLCVFDLGRNHFGCEVVALNDNRIQLREDPSWQPIITVSPINSTTFTINVAGLAAGLPLKAHLLPLDGLATAELTLAENSQGYAYTLNLAEPTSLGYVQLWVDEPYNETNPRREAIVGYAVSGGPGHKHGSGGGGSDDDGGGHKHGSGGGDRRNNGGGMSYSGDAPILSMNGNFIYVDLNEPELGADQFYAIQDMASCPPLPPGKKVVDVCYYLYGSAAAPPLTGSVTIQYSTYDLSQENISALEEEALKLYYWNGTHWQALDTTLISYFNWASAFSQGSGVYALMSGETTPTLLDLAPTQAINNVTTTLIITGLNFISPLQVTLRYSNNSYNLPFTTTTMGVTTTVTAIITPGLPAAEYEVIVTNLADHIPTTPVKFALYDPNPTACFYDTFSSGLWGKWQLGMADWQIDDYGRLNDSIDKNYDSAPHYSPTLTYTNMITSMPFSLTNCPNPALMFGYAHAVMQGDITRIEVSTNGQTWQELFLPYTYIAGCPTNRAQRADEWEQATWQTALLDLSPYSQTTNIQLRFSLEVNSTCADKGWVIDDITVKTYTGTIPITTNAPIANDDQIIIHYQPSLTFTVLANDSDPNHDVLTVTHFTSPQHGQLSLQANTFIYTPDLAYNGVDSFHYIITDGVLTSTAMVTIYVFAYPAPIAVGDNFTLRQARGITFTPLSNDLAFSGTLTLLQVQTPQHGVIQQIGSTLIYTPDHDLVGTEVLTYQIADDAATAIGIITITIIADAPPIAMPDIITLTRVMSQVLEPLANDFDEESDPLIITQITQPLSGTVVISGSQLVYSPTVIFTSTDIFSYTISDGVFSAATTVTVVMKLPQQVYLPMLLKN